MVEKAEKNEVMLKYECLSYWEPVFHFICNFDVASQCNLINSLYFNVICKHYSSTLIHAKLWWSDEGQYSFYRLTKLLSNLLLLNEAVYDVTRVTGSYLTPVADTPLGTLLFIAAFRQHPLVFIALPVHQPPAQVVHTVRLSAPAPTSTRLGALCVRTELTFSATLMTICYSSQK